MVIRCQNDSLTAYIELSIVFIFKLTIDAVDIDIVRIDNLGGC